MVVFPSLFLMSHTRFYPAVRAGIAALAFSAAVAWVMDRLGVLDNPFAVITLAAERRLGANTQSPDVEPTISTSSQTPRHTTAP
ncbi:MAG: hypothetical protein WBG89_06085 [Ornithinimicrobium sp.]